MRCLSVESGLWRYGKSTTNAGHVLQGRPHWNEAATNGRCQRRIDRSCRLLLRPTKSKSLHFKAATASEAMQTVVQAAMQDFPRWALPSAGVRGHASEKEQTRCWLFATCVMGLEGIQGSCVSAQRWKGRIRSLLPLPATVSACFFSNQHRGPRRGCREQQPGNPFDRTEFFSKFWGPAASRETKWIHSPHIYIYIYILYVCVYIYHINHNQSIIHNAPIKVIWF